MGRLDVDKDVLLLGGTGIEIADPRIGLLSGRDIDAVDATSYKIAMQCIHVCCASVLPFCAILTTKDNQNPSSLSLIIKPP